MEMSGGRGLRKLRVRFSDMWGHGDYQFDPYTSYFYKLLSLQYDVEIAIENIDLLIYSCFGDKHKEIDAKVKLYFCGENTDPPGGKRKIKPDYSECDISLSQFPSSDKNYYFPLWALFVNWFFEENPLKLPSNPTYLTNQDDLISGRNEYGNEKIHDCCFMNNNPVEDRIMLYNKLSKHMKVNSYGKLFNNVGYMLRGHEGDKCEIVKSHKLTIAYENSFRHGYNTEKIIHPYSVGSIAIYSGGLDRTIFNSKALFYDGDYSTMDDMIEDIVECISNKRLYKEKVSESLFINDEIPVRFKPVSVLSWLMKKLHE